MNRDRAISDITAMAEQLCDPHRHSEPIYDRDHNRNKKMTRIYSTTQDSLLVQLREVMHLGLKVAEPTRGGGKPGSKPPGVLEALDRHVYIAVEATRWAQIVGLQVRMMPEENIRGLVGKAANLDDQTLDQLVREIRFWHSSALMVTGWHLPPWAPNVRCPSCKMLGSLRITTTDDIRQMAGYCTNRARTAEGELVCGSSWPAGETEPLIGYIRASASAVLAQAG